MSCGPNGMAIVCRDKLAEIKTELEVCTDKEQRKALNKHAHLLKRLIRFCETRVGYVSQAAEAE